MGTIHKTVVKGSTDVSVVVRCLGTVSFAAQQSFAETSWQFQYFRDGGTNFVSFAGAALSFLSSAHTDGGAEPIVNGYYRVDIPDAAVAKAAGVNGVFITAFPPAANTFIEGCFIQLVDADRAPFAKTPEVY